jgi:hypothetical protein
MITPRSFGYSLRAPELNHMPSFAFRLSSFMTGDSPCTSERKGMDVSPFVICS